jgi:hypothetical protein
LICGKSWIRLAICEEKNHTSNPIMITRKSMEQKIASDSGNFNRLKNLYTGNSMIDRKKAISSGVIISLPTKMTIPRKQIPISSSALLTVTGIGEIFHLCPIKLGHNELFNFKTVIGING